VLSNTEIDQYLSGSRLYGNDLSLSEIEQWYADEGEGYANLGASDKNSYQYAYHALNQLHGYANLKLQSDLEVLGFGSAYGEELEPVLDLAKHITIIDPSDAFVKHQIGTVPCTYVKPTISGQLPFAAGHFDFVTAFGVLHHVPNVFTVLSEIARVMKPGATMLLREPVVSMGDWRFPRAGLTRHERGIPRDLLNGMISDVGLVVRHEALCVFPPLSIIFQRVVPRIYNNLIITRLDKVFCKLFSWNLTYHAISNWRKIRPTSAFYILEKPCSGDSECMQKS